MINIVYDTRDDLSELEEDYKDQNDWQEGDTLPEFKELLYDNTICSLKDILDKLDPNIDLSKVKIKLNRDRIIKFLKQEY